MFLAPDSAESERRSISVDSNICGVFCVFFVLLADACTCPILGPLTTLFWISGDVPSLFQSQSGFCLIRIGGGECTVHSLKQKYSVDSSIHVNGVNI